VRGSDVPIYINSLKINPFEKRLWGPSLVDKDNDLAPAKRILVAEHLTTEINDLFLNSRARVSGERLCERTAIRFTPYRRAKSSPE
jgi:hypothetical protein